MSSHLPAAARPAASRPAVATLVVVVALTACGTTTPSPSASGPANAVANERGGQPIGLAQPGATDAAAHADLHQPAGSGAGGPHPDAPARGDGRGAADQRVRHDARRLRLRLRRPGTAVQGPAGRLRERSAPLALRRTGRAAAADHPPAGAVPGDGRPLCRHRRAASRAVALPAHRRARDLGAAGGQRHRRRHPHLHLGRGRLRLPADRRGRPAEPRHARRAAGRAGAGRDAAAVAHRAGRRPGPPARRPAPRPRRAPVPSPRCSP